MGQHDFATSDFRCGIEELTCSRSHARKYTLLRSRRVSHFSPKFFGVLLHFRDESGNQ
jgi:hypothetical protein